MSYKLLSYAADNGPRAGILVRESILDAQIVSGKAEYQTVLGVLNDWDAADRLFSGFAGKSSCPAGGKPLAGTRLLAPVLYPGQIWGAGANYQDHIDEIGKTEFLAKNAKLLGGRPWHFSKSSRSAVVGHGSVRPLPHYSKMVDWEIELAAVVGKTASQVSAGEALDYVAGYTIANDLSARDYAARDGIEPTSPFRFDWISHKGFDGACPMGPWIVPARDIPDPQMLGLKLWVNQELMQDSNTKYMIFSIAEQIEEISARVTLNPGDVILTGTPSGTGVGRKVFLKSGQQLRLWIEGIGELQHGFS